MINNDIIVSVVIPVWNAVDYISEMLDSIIAQDYEYWELLLIDDGCTDGTTIFLKEYEKKDTRISYFLRDRGPKGGQTCRNIGLEKAVGKYVVFFDADDFVTKDCLSQRVYYMQQHPYLDYAVFPAKDFVYKVGDSSTLFGVCYGKDILDSFFRGYIYFSGWTNIYKRQSLLFYNSRWDISLLSLQDWDFCIQNILCGMRYEYANEANIDYYVRTRINKNSVSKNAYGISHLQSHYFYYRKTVMSVHKYFGKKYDNALLLHGLNIVLSRGYSCETVYWSMFKKQFVSLSSYNKYMDLKMYLYIKLIPCFSNRRLLKMIFFPSLCISKFLVRKLKKYRNVKG